MNLQIESITNRIIRAGSHIGQRTTSVVVRGSSNGQDVESFLNSLFQSKIESQIVSFRCMNLAEIFNPLMEVSHRLREMGYLVVVVQMSSSLVFPTLEDIPKATSWVFEISSSMIFPYSNLNHHLSPGYVEIIIIENDDTPVDTHYLRRQIEQTPIVRFLDISIFSKDPGSLISSLGSPGWFGKSLGIHIFPIHHFTETLSYL